MPIISPTAISPHRIGGAKNWSSYWATQIEAKAFGDAAGITDETQQRALATLVADLKAINATQADFVNFDTPANSICLAIYPFVGGTADAHKWNLKDPRDNDSAFRLSFFGGWTHAATGAKPNGTTGYAKTFIDVHENCPQYSFHGS